MATPNTKPESTFVEAPASWNTRYVTREGFTCQITIRGESGKDLLEKAGIALSYLLEHGYTPERSHQRHHGRNNNKSQRDGRICPIHQCQMKRFEKDGNAWFSHKTDDGNWCRGNPKGS